MDGTFVILNNGVLETYNKFEDIPQSFDNVIKFYPKALTPPHTEEEHEEMETYGSKLDELMKRCKNGN